MNYSEFLKMIPEAFLVLSLLIVFVADFCLSKTKVKGYTMQFLTVGMLVVSAAATLLLAKPESAFGGLYVTSAAVNVMKVILAVGTVIVCIMAQPWIQRSAMKLEGEFYMLIISTLLGMYIMMSSGNFLLFFLGLETASVPLACLVAFDKWKQNSAEGAMSQLRSLL